MTFMIENVSRKHSKIMERNAAVCILNKMKYELVATKNMEQNKNK